MTKIVKFFCVGGGCEARTVKLEIEVSKNMDDMYISEPLLPIIKCPICNTNLENEEIKNVS